VTIHRCQTAACDPPERELALLGGDGPPELGFLAAFSSKEFLKVRFQSDGSANAQGFEGHWKIWENVPATVSCSGMVHVRVSDASLLQGSLSLFYLAHHLSTHVRAC
jgi:hypothetical protein